MHVAGNEIGKEMAQSFVHADETLVGSAMVRLNSVEVACGVTRDRMPFMIVGLSEGLTQSVAFVLCCFFLCLTLAVTMFGERDALVPSLSARRRRESCVCGRFIDTSIRRFGWWSLR